MELTKMFRAIRQARGASVFPELGEDQNPFVGVQETPRNRSANVDA